MYILSFLKNLFRPRKFLCSLYFLLNLVIIFFIFGYMGIFYQGSSETETLVINGLIGMAVNFVIMLIALSPIGEAYVRYKEKAKKIKRTSDTEWLYALFDEVYAKAKQNNPKISDKVKLYFQNISEPNAAAVGHRTVIVTAGLVDSMDEEEIKGVLCHEFGHISSGDSDLSLGIAVSNCILMVFTWICCVIVGIFTALISSQSEKTGAIFHLIFVGILTIAYSLWVKLGLLLMNATSRKDEYAADAFAVDCGYGVNLYQALESLDGSKMKSSFLSLLASTHPDTVDRLAAIKSRLAEKSGTVSAQA